MPRCRISDYEGFKKILAISKNIVALSGAGISQESGIPVFRGAGGLWGKYRSEDLASPYAFKSNPGLVWEFYHYRREVAFKCQPNAAHYALTKLESDCKTQNKKFGVITQNVDGLHRRAQTENVIELHGTLTKVQCTKCKIITINTDSPICESLRDRGDPDRQEDLKPIDVDLLPKCNVCGGLIRPYIVWFGEHLEPDVLDAARRLIESCDLCLVIGTSSGVYPAAMFAPLVADRGGTVAEFNLDAEPSHYDFEFHFPGPCGTTLPKTLGYA